MGLLEVFQLAFCLRHHNFVVNGGAAFVAKHKIRLAISIRLRNCGRSVDQNIWHKLLYWWVSLKQILFHIIFILDRLLELKCLIKAKCQVFRRLYLRKCAEYLFQSRHISSLSWIVLWFGVWVSVYACCLLLLVGAYLGQGDHLFLHWVLRGFKNAKLRILTKHWPAISFLSCTFFVRFKSSFLINTFLNFWKSLVQLHILRHTPRYLHIQVQLLDLAKCMRYQIVFR